MTTAVLPPVPAIETTRVCKTCGVEKPIEDFEQWQKFRGKSWRLRECKQCWSTRRQGYYLKRVARNLALYGVKSSLHKLEYNCRLRRSLESNNLAVYGRLQSPERYKARRLYARERRGELRAIVLSLYGGKCECCSETDARVLTVDHINGNGNVERRSGIASNDPRFYTKLISLGYPNNQYRLLCMNCNTAISRFGECPHIKPDIFVTNVTKYTAKLHRLKLEMIAAYGGCCQLCGETHPEFLTIDHVNGNGTEHRVALGMLVGGARFYYWLRRQGWPKGEYRLLCFNCNFADGVERLRQETTEREESV